MADFLREGGITWLSRLDDGSVMCSICYEYKQPNELFVDASGQKWDVCPGLCAIESGLDDGG